MRRTLALLMLAVTVTAAGCHRDGEASGDDGGSSASCAGPYLDGQPPGGPFGSTGPTVTPGATVTVYGHWYTETCNDTGGNEPHRPMPPVTLTVTLPGSEQFAMGPFEPSGPDLGFWATIDVPADTLAGVVTVSDGSPFSAYTFHVQTG